MTISQLKFIRLYQSFLYSILPPITFRDFQSKPDQLKVRCGDWNIREKSAEEKEAHVEKQVEHISIHPGKHSLFVHSLGKTVNVFCTK